MQISANLILIFASEKTEDMNKRTWFVPFLIVIINALAIAVRWNSLSEILPAHFDLQGNASGTMPRNLLLVYPLMSAAFCVAAYVFAGIKAKLQNGLIVLTSGVSLIMLSSTMVTLTFGKMPIFMLAEPVILLAAVACFVVCVLKSGKGAVRQ